MLFLYCSEHRGMEGEPCAASCVFREASSPQAAVCPSTRDTRV